MKPIINLFFCLAFILLTAQVSKAQSNTSQDSKKNIVSGNIGGASSIIGINYQRFIGNKFAIEFGLGLIGIGTGLTIYPKGLTDNGARFYTGIKLNSVVLVDVGGGTVGYVPFGITFFSESPFIIGFDIGPAYGKLSSSSFGGQASETTYFYGFGNLKIGVRF